MGTISIDIGGTNIKLGFIRDGKILDSMMIPASDNFRQSIQDTTDIINAMLEKQSISPGKLEGLGISIPGIVNTHCKQVLSIHAKHSGAVDFNFHSWARNLGFKKLVMDNDARAALIGEWQYGAGQGCENLAMITLGTGIGGAAMINGKLLYGQNYQAGCLGGHLIVDYDSMKCNCGNIGCAEAMASSWSLPKWIASHPKFKGSIWENKQKQNFKSLFKEYENDDKLAVEVVEHCLKVWAAAGVNMIHAYDPQKIIFGGGLMKSHKHILPYLNKQINKLSWSGTGTIQIEKTALEDTAALLGIAFLLRKYSH